MAYQPFNYAGIAPQGYDAMASLAQMLESGSKAVQNPQRRNAEIQQMELQNALKGIQNARAPEQIESDMGLQNASAKLKDAQADDFTRKAEDPLHGVRPSGDVANAYVVEQLAKGDPNDPLVQSMRKAFENKQRSQDILDRRNEKLTGTQDKRYSTPAAKRMQEKREIEMGFVPGTNGEVALSPEDQHQALVDMELIRQKQVGTTDSQKREKYAQNIEKTLSRINADDLVQYGGWFGLGEKGAEQFKAAFGNESEKYARFKDAEANAKLLSKQIRQFYGDSIQPSVIEKIERMVNPASWKNNPRIAKRQFNQLVGTLELEMDTFREALGKLSKQEGGSPTGPTGPAGDKPILKYNADGSFS